MKSQHQSKCFLNGTTKCQTCCFKSTRTFWNGLLPVLTPDGNKFQNRQNQWNLILHTISIKIKQYQTHTQIEKVVELHKLNERENISMGKQTFVIGHSLKRRSRHSVTGNLVAGHSVFWAISLRASIFILYL